MAKSAATSRKPTKARNVPAMILGLNLEQAGNADINNENMGKLERPVGVSRQHQSLICSGKISNIWWTSLQLSLKLEQE